jgi:hypothetical protein
MTLTAEKVAKKCGLLLLFSENRPKVNKRPLGESWLNLVTLNPSEGDDETFSISKLPLSVRQKQLFKKKKQEILCLFPGSMLQFFCNNLLLIKFTQ